MAVTQNTYTGNGSTQNYVFSFGYLDPSHVKATINGTPTTAFTFFNASTLQFTTAPADGAAIRIYRETPSDNLLADYTAGSALREQDLELTLQQVLNVTQETQTFAENQSTTGLQAQITTANNNASNAVTTANAAEATANSFAGSITTANTNASNAVTTAGTANTNASNAVTTANNASTAANAALARSGGTMTGAITHISTQQFNGASANITGDITFNTKNGAPLAGPRNKLINSDFIVNQRNSNTVVTCTGATTSQWVCDRWNLVNTGNTSSISAQVVGGSPPAPANRFIQCTVNTNKTPSTSDRCYIRQPIEGRNIRDLLTGEANALPVVLTFWARTSVTGTHTGHFRYTDGTLFRSYCFTYSVPTANVWQKVVISIPALTTFQPLAGTNEGASVLFDLGSGASSRTASANQFITTSALGVTGSVNLISTSGATFSFTLAQLEPGTVSTPFECRSISEETQLCLRYFERMYARLGGYHVAGSISFINIPFKVPKRAIPTIGWTTGTATNISTGNDQSQNLDEFLHFAQITGTGGFEWSSFTTADAEL